MSLSDFLDRCLEMATDVGKSFDSPDDDWMPVMLVEDAAGKFGLVGIMSMGSEQEKNAFAQAIPDLLTKLNARKACLLVSAWTLEMKTRQPGAYSAADMPLPSESPDRVEKLILNGFSAEETQMVSVPILRDGINPPTLGEREEMPGMASEGRFVDPFLAYFGTPTSQAN